VSNQFDQPDTGHGAPEREIAAFIAASLKSFGYTRSGAETGRTALWDGSAALVAAESDVECAWRHGNFLDGRAVSGAIRDGKVYGAVFST